MFSIGIDSSDQSDDGNEEADMFDDEEVDKYQTYEEYLDSLVSEEDHKYLEDEDMARTIAELGYRSSGDTLSREGFYKLKSQLAESRNLISKRKTAEQSLTEDFEVEEEFSNKQETPLVRALKNRAPLIQSGELKSIIFMRTIFSKRAKAGDKEYRIELSGHIDLADRQLSENWVPYLTGERRLRLKSNGLTFFHWNRGTGYFNSTENFEVRAELSAAYVIHKPTGKRINITDTTSDNGWVRIPDENSFILIYDLPTKKSGKV